MGIFNHTVNIYILHTYNEWNLITNFLSRLVSFNLSHRSGKKSAISHSDSDLDLNIGGRRSQRKSRSRSPRVDRDDVYNDVDLDDLSTPKVSTDFTTDAEDDTNQSADIVAETKYRLKSLEKEAQVDYKLYLTSFII